MIPCLERASYGIRAQFDSSLFLQRPKERKHAFNGERRSRNNIEMAKGRRGPLLFFLGCIANALLLSARERESHFLD